MFLLSREILGRTHNQRHSTGDAEMGKGDKRMSLKLIKRSSAHMLSRAAGRNINLYILVFWYHAWDIFFTCLYNDNVDTKVKRSVDVGVMLFYYYYYYCPIVTPITDNEPPQAAGE